ncbi:MAG: C-GCAxxG-C-C family protein [Anaerolineae bacterium]|jgi:C_GCAxxG_C_C family probable redox protein|nr:C-GCAxxG-C-C family protein [Anaerolineae bacterium]
MSYEYLRDLIASEAEARMRQGFHCSEAVLMTLGPYVTQPWNPACIRLATGFVAGMGGTRQDVCGALVGSVMVLGAAAGRNTVADDGRLRRLVARCRDRFLDAFGTTQCGQIREAIIEIDGGPGTCAPLAGQVAGMLWDQLVEAGLVMQDGTDLGVDELGRGQQYDIT